MKNPFENFFKGFEVPTPDKEPEQLPHVIGGPSNVLRGRLENQEAMQRKKEVEKEEKIGNLKKMGYIDEQPDGTRINTLNGESFDKPRLPSDDQAAAERIERKIEGARDLRRQQYVAEKKPTPLEALAQDIELTPADIAAGITKLEKMKGITPLKKLMKEGLAGQSNEGLPPDMKLAVEIGKETPEENSKKLEQIINHPNKPEEEIERKFSD